MIGCAKQCWLVVPREQKFRTRANMQVTRIECCQKNDARFDFVYHQDLGSESSLELGLHECHLVGNVGAPSVLGNRDPCLYLTNTWTTRWVHSFWNIRKSHGRPLNGRERSLQQCSTVTAEGLGAFFWFREMSTGTDWRTLMGLGVSQKRTKIGNTENFQIPSHKMAATDLLRGGITHQICNLPFKILNKVSAA